MTFPRKLDSPERQVRHYVLLTGATGCGKAWLACALGHALVQWAQSKGIALQHIQPAKPTVKTTP